MCRTCTGAQCLYQKGIAVTGHPQNLKKRQVFMTLSSTAGQVVKLTPHIQKELQKLSSAGDLQASLHENTPVIYGSFQCPFPVLLYSPYTTPVRTPNGSFPKQGDPNVDPNIL